MLAMGRAFSDHARDSCPRFHRARGHQALDPPCPGANGRDVGGREVMLAFLASLRWLEIEQTDERSKIQKTTQCEWEDSACDQKKHSTDRACTRPTGNGGRQRHQTNP